MTQSAHIVRPAVRAWLLSLGLMVISCRDPEQAATIVISVDSDLAVARDLDQVRVETFDVEGAEQSDRDTIVLKPGAVPGSEHALPIMFHTEMAGADRFLLVASGLKGGEVVVQRRVLVRYQEHRTRFLQVFLGGACYQKLCSRPDRTCYPETTPRVSAGQCGGIPEAELLDLDPRDERGLWSSNAPPFDWEAASDAGVEASPDGDSEPDAATGRQRDAGLDESDDPEAGAHPEPACGKGFTRGGLRCLPALDDLGVGAGSLEPAFDPSIAEYFVDLGMWRDSFDLTVQFAEGHEVVFDGEKVTAGQVLRRGVPVGETKFEVVVRVADQTRSYTVLVVRREPSEHFLKPTEIEASALFGRAVALSEDGKTLAVSASGAAYIFERNGDRWHQQARLAPPEQHVVRFGAPIALSADGRTLVVAGQTSRECSTDAPSSNPCTDERYGVVYVYEKDFGWHGRLTPAASFSQAYPEFGATLAIDRLGQRLVIGYPLGLQVYSRAAAEWSGPISIRGDDARLPVQARSPHAVALDASGTTLAALNDAGVLLLDYRLGAWNPSPTSFVVQGSQVSMALSGDGGTFLLGPTEDGASFASYSYFEGTWSSATLFRSTDWLARPAFGASVAASSDGQTLAIGGPGEQPPTTYIFTHSLSGWAGPAKPRPANGNVAQHFGSAVALGANGAVLVVGAPGEASCTPEQASLADKDEMFCPGAGAVYVYE